MVQISSFRLKFDSKNNNVLDIVKAKVKHTTWYDVLYVEDNDILIKENTSISWEQYNQLVFEVCKEIVIKESQESFFCKAEFYSDELEIHESIIYKNTHLQHYYVKEVYAEDCREEKYYFGQYKNNKLSYEEIDEDDYDMEEVMCPSCGEYIKKYEKTPFSYCPYCDCIESYEDEEEVPVSNSPWLTRTFETPLEVILPSTPISVGQDWLADCEEDKVFGLHPSYYVNKNKYDAALRLCRACDGWYHFENDEEKQKMIGIYREIIKAKEKEPMWYYSLDMNNFDWLKAVRECNPKYSGKLLSIDSVWSLFNQLGMRSCMEKADCFEWIINFFGEYLKYEGRYGRISDNYVQGYYDNSLETILYLREHQIDILTKSVAKVSGNNLSCLARVAAGLIRMGKKEVGLSMYKKVFAMAWTDKNTTTEDKKNVINSFVERLAQGYENEPYIDEDIASLLEKQCQKYSDGAWTSKIRMSLGR